jgi:hypothetical protein
LLLLRLPLLYLVLELVTLYVISFYLQLLSNSILNLQRWQVIAIN